MFRMASFALLAICFLASTAQAQKICTLNSLKPGDRKFCHHSFHQPYKNLFWHLNQKQLKGGGMSRADFDRLHEHIIRVRSNQSTAKPGDDGFMQQDKDLLSYYQALYSGTRCNCDYGSCRPTKIRPVNAKNGEQSESGWMVLVNRRWWPVPGVAILKENEVTPKLQQELRLDEIAEQHEGVNGHVCALPVPAGTGPIVNGQRQPFVNECTLIPKPSG